MRFSNDSELVLQASGTNLCKSGVCPALLGVGSTESCRGEFALSLSSERLGVGHLRTPCNLVPSTEPAGTLEHSGQEHTRQEHCGDAPPSLSTSRGPLCAPPPRPRDNSGGEGEGGGGRQESRVAAGSRESSSGVPSWVASPKPRGPTIGVPFSLR